MFIETAQNDLLTLCFSLSRDGEPVSLRSDPDGFESIAFRCRIKTADGDRLLAGMTDSAAAARGDSAAHFVFDLKEIGAVPGTYPFELILCRRTNDEVVSKQTIAFADENTLVIHPQV